MSGWRLLFRAIAIVAVALSVCSACVGEQGKRGPLVEDILGDVPCAAPCWQGITFGQTTEQEAIAILTSRTRGRYIGKSYLSRRESIGETDVRWFTEGARMPRGVSALSELVILRGKAHHVDLVLDSGLTVQMVIDKWGEPSSFFVRQVGIEWAYTWATLCYPTQGIQFGVYLNADSKPLTLEPEDKVLLAEFYAPMSEEQWLDEPLDQYPWRWRPSDPAKILTWPGYGPLPQEAIH